MNQAEKLLMNLSETDLLKYLVKQANLMLIKRIRIPIIGDFYYELEDSSVIKHDATGLQAYDEMPAQKELTTNDRKKIKIARRMAKRRNRV